MAWLDLYARPQQLARVNRRRRLNLLAMGEGGPTVVLAAGFLGLTLDWARVQPFVARFARTVSFDTAGLGFSDPGPAPRTSTAIIQDLRAALRSAGFAPPYILVGHSAGGLRMRLFAALHPDEIAGLVLVDPVTADFEARLFSGPAPALVRERGAHRRLLALARAGALTSNRPEYREHIGLPRAGLTPAVNAALHAMWTRPSYLRTAISESQHFSAFSEEEALADRRCLGTTPLVVLSAGRVGDMPMIGGDQTLVEAWFTMHDDIVALSKRGEKHTVDSGHNIPIERPREVVAAIQHVIEMLG
jgi:pimeloyl-ACP methyl ester carboxylesterase